MKILGIDPGFKATGYGLIEKIGGQVKLLEVGAIEPKPKDLLQNKLERVYTELKDILIQYQPDVLVLEKIFTHYKHPATASVLGHVRGVICLLCAQQKIRLVEHSVKRIRKAVTGNGNASKDQVQKLVGHVLGIDVNRLTLDASDALALALGFIQIEGRRL